jgi:hypothetical protein
MITSDEMLSGVMSREVRGVAISKREHFAAMAMQGLVARPDSVAHDQLGDLIREEAALAVAYADALLAELAKPNTGEPG